MRRLDVMVDLETLGLTPANPLIQIAAVAFNLDTGTEVSTFNTTIFSNGDEQVNMATLRWWLQTDAALLQDLMMNATSSEREALMSFSSWLEDTATAYGVSITDVKLWGNGVLFDNYLIKEKMTAHGLEYPIFYRNDRDVRTVVDLYMLKTGAVYDDLWKACHDGSRVHNAIDDCRSQIKMLRICWEALQSSTPTAE